MLAAGLMAYTGVQLLSLPIFGTTILPTPVLVLFTVLVVIASTNAVNFIDGLDGLAAGVVGIAAFAFFIYSYLVSRSFVPANVFSTATFISRRPRRVLRRASCRTTSTRPGSSWATPGR